MKKTTKAAAQDLRKLLDKAEYPVILVSVDDPESAVAAGCALSVLDADEGIKIMVVTEGAAQILGIVWPMPMGVIVASIGPQHPVWGDAWRDDERTSVFLDEGKAGLKQKGLI